MDSSKANPLKVMFVSAETLTEGYAAHTHVTGLAKALQQLGHQTTIIGKSSGTYFSTSIPARLARYVSVNLAAIRAMKNHDVLIARGHFANLLWVLVARMRGIPVVQEMNGLLKDAATTHHWLRLIQKPIAWSYRTQLKSAAAVACVTKDIASQIRSFAVDAPVEIISNGVDTTVFHEDNQASNQSDYVIFCSALTAWHGLGTLLEAVKHPSWPKGLRLLIAGDGAEAHMVKSAASKNHMITYVGLQNRAALAKLMRSAALGLCPLEKLAQRGVNEVSPLKLYEMMASGIAIVATDLAGQRELIQSTGCGIIVPPADPVSLAQAVHRVYNSPDRIKMGQKGADAVTNGHGWSHRASTLSALLYLVKSRNNGGLATAP